MESESIRNLKSLIAEIENQKKHALYCHNKATEQIVEANEKLERMVNLIKDYDFRIENLHKAIKLLSIEL